MFRSHQPSGSEGGPSVGPSWVVGVGGRVITMRRRKKVESKENGGQILKEER
jgi:hypothetical protein